MEVRFWNSVTGDYVDDHALVALVEANGRTEVYRDDEGQLILDSELEAEFYFDGV